MTGTSDSRSRARLAFFIAAALLAGAHVAWQTWLVAASPYPAAYDYDEGVYAETARAAAAGAGLYSEVFLSQPPLLIGALSRAFMIFGATLATARGVVAAFSVIWLLSLGAIAAAGGSRRAAIWAIAGALSAPAFVAASHTVQMEAPAEALAALAVALSLAAARRSGTAEHHAAGAADALWAAAGAAAGLAVMTKLTAFTSLVPVAAAAAGRPRDLARAAAGLVLAAAAVTAWTGSPPAALWAQAVWFHAAVAHATPFDPRRTAALLAQFAATNWLVVVLGLAGLAQTVGPRRHTFAGGGRVGRIAAVWLAADLVAVIAARPLWAHHLAILISPLTVLAGAGVEAAVARTVGGTALRPVNAAALVFAWIVAVAGTAAAVRPAVSAPLAAAAAQVRAEVPGTAQVLADDPIVAFLGGRGVPPALCDTSDARIRAGRLTESMLRAALTDSRVGGVVLWRGTFRRRFPAVVDAAVRDFPRRWDAGDGRVILSR